MVLAPVRSLEVWGLHNARRANPRVLLALCKIESQSVRSQFDPIEAHQFQVVNPNVTIISTLLG
ncbi:hypothetical protein [Myxacorys almedinensis]|uniref:Uncharacterized protein n=1 Tax=Myxacorys almedinensis A TaxID=2690445 RepID=A0A8J8CIX5_9CYAN|nr:hypothetical protein [Myxacorys almedinensis]NDJ17001.1 hypothetical protein [Myxacorys almedinensis A]